MTRTHAVDAALQLGTRQIKIAHQVENLVANELVLVAQAVLIEDPIARYRDSIF